MTRVAGRLVVWSAAFALALVVAGALFADVFAAHDPNEQHLTHRLRPPAWVVGGSLQYLLGTDALGRDVLSRLLYGGRVTLGISLGAVLIAGLVGISLGLVGGFYGGALDELITRLFDVQLAIPVMLFAVAVIAVLDVSLQNLVLVLAAAGWVLYGRIVRSQVLTVKQREFIVAARASGASNARIIVRHLLPNVANTCLVVATLEIAHVISLESSLSFLGLGVRPPSMSWGSVLGDGRDHLVRAWWIVTCPGLAISAVVISVNMLGDALRDRIDPGLRT